MHPSSNSLSTPLQLFSSEPLFFDSSFLPLANLRRFPDKGLSELAFPAMGCVVSKKAAPVTPAVESADVSGSLEWSRGTLNSALWNRIEVDRAESGESEKYFRSKPYASDPSSLPKYPPNKEIDGRNREELLRMKLSSTMRPPEVTRRPSISKRSQRSKILSKLSGVEEAWFKAGNTQRCVGKQNLARVNDEAGLFVDMHHKAAIHPENGDLRENPTSHLDPFSAPIPSAASSRFKWQRKRAKTELT